MSATLRFALFQIVIVVPFLAGTCLRPRMADSTKTSGRLIRFNLILVEPFIALWSIWGLDLGRDMVLLPLSGLLLVLAGMAAGKGLASIFYRTRWISGALAFRKNVN